MRSSIIAIIALLGVSITAHAKVVPVLNGDFEDTTEVYPDGATGWSTSHLGGGDGYGIGTYDMGGTNHACIFNNGSSSQVLSQLIGYSITPGSDFQVDFDFNNGGVESWQAWTKVNVNLYARHPGLGTYELIGSHSYVRSEEFSSAYEWKHFSDTYTEDGTHAGWQVFIQFQVQGLDNTTTRAPFLDNVVITEIPVSPDGTVTIIQ